MKQIEAVVKLTLFYCVMFEWLWMWEWYWQE